MLNEQDLVTLKSRIDQAKNKSSELQGRIDYLMKELKKTWGCSTVKEAKVRLTKMEKEINDVETHIRKGIQKLEEELE